MCLHGKRSERRETRAREARLRVPENSVKLLLLFPNQIIRTRFNCTDEVLPITEDRSEFNQFFDIELVRGTTNEHRVSAKSKIL